MKIPKEVLKWVQERKGFRTPIYAPGYYQIYVDSKLAAYWGGNPYEVGDYLVSVCQPSPVFAKQATPIWFDFKKK